MAYEQAPRGRAPTGSGSGSGSGQQQPQPASRRRDDRPPGAKSGGSSSKPHKVSQKAMLSKALQKANTAVQLDNAQNFEGARVAYTDACDLLQQVLQKTSSDEDKRKLEAIRKTYTSRIEELDQLGYDDLMDDKELPARPDSTSYPPSISTTVNPDDDDEGEVSIVETATLTRIIHHTETNASPSTNITGNPWTATQPDAGYPLSAESGRSREGNNILQRLEEEEDVGEVPRLQLHQGRAVPVRQADQVSSERDWSMSVPISASTIPESTPATDVQGSYGEPDSWLDSKLGSGGSSCSSSSSVHSRTSSLDVRRKHLPRASGATEAEFDAALDAAVEAAYDDGLEPADSDGEDHGSAVAQALRRVALAKERVRESEREAFQQELERDARNNNEAHQGGYGPSSSAAAIPEGFYHDNSSEDEENLLEEMTRGYEIEDFAFTERPASPRAAQAAGPVSNTWGSLSVPSRADMMPERSSSRNAMATLSAVPLPEESPIFHEDAMPQGVRSRRFSGQNTKQLKIETAKLSTAARYRDSLKAADQPANTTTHQSGESPVDAHGGEPTDSYTPDYEDEDAFGSPVSPLARSLLAKNYSSSSLRSGRSRNLSLSNLDEVSDHSPGTPSSSNPFSSTTRLQLHSTASTPMLATFDDQMSTDPAESLYLFDAGLQEKQGPGSPDMPWSDPPVALEPCPSDLMLRPFWLMRCLYQTLAHSRGGYLSSRVFVPQEVWKVKGVRLRGVEDKVAACDYLTAALLKLAQVDTCDADAVLVEMQALEGVLDQLSATLARRLGSDVGASASGLMFKDSGGGGGGGGGDQDASSFVSAPKSNSFSSKPSTSFSWRRLKAKNSSAGLSGTYNSSRMGDTGLDSPLMDTLPMTVHPTHKPPKRALGEARFSGPHAGYMESLARLFDAAQTVDQIARQVEDPGLRHADKTQVGLELCTRHAAEFFSFYICRFVLSDLGILLEKFIKRGTEWVIT